MPKVENATSNNEAQGRGRRDLTGTSSFLLSQTCCLPHLRRIPGLYCVPAILGEEEQGRVCYQVYLGRSLERGLEGKSPRLLYTDADAGEAEKRNAQAKAEGTYALSCSFYVAHPFLRVLADLFRS